MSALLTRAAQLDAAARQAWPASLRGMVAIGTPLLIGVLTGHRLLGMIVALGGLWGVTQDAPGPYRQRAERILSLAVVSAVGMLCGDLASRADSKTAVTAVTLTIVAAVGGFVSPSGPVASVAGMHLLLGAIMGSGLRLTGSVWLGPGLLLGGAAVVLVLSCMRWAWRRGHDQIGAVGSAFTALADLLAVVGHGSAHAARRRAVAALDAAEDVVGVRSGKSVRTAAAARCLAVAARVAEVAGVLQAEDRPVPQAYVDAVRKIGEDLHRHEMPLVQIPDARSEPAAVRALHNALATAADQRLFGDVARPVRTSVSFGERTRLALVLAGAILGADLLGVAMNGPRPYWMPLSVAFIFKPDMGPVFSRALARVAGTAAGVVLFAVLGRLIVNVYALIAVAAVCAALLPVASRLHHGLTVFTFTPVVFVFLDIIGQDHHLLQARIVDTGLAALIVLVVEFLIWPRSSTRRAIGQVEAAQQAAANYAELAPEVGEAERHALRRGAFRAIREARRALALAEAEPRSRVHAADYEPALRAAEELCDRTTIGLLAAHGAAS